jgi:methionyl-tRNA synthetase
MDIIRIAGTISEQAYDSPQKLFDRYLESIQDSFYHTACIPGFTDFSSYCSVKGVIITEDQFLDLLANNTKYLFTEIDGFWSCTPIDEAEETLFKDPSYDPEHPEECCPHCGARQERGDDGICNRCGEDWPEN